MIYLLYAAAAGIDAEITPGILPVSNVAQTPIRQPRGGL